jgi:hypothetical protein
MSQTGVSLGDGLIVKIGSVSNAGDGCLPDQD